MLTLPRRLEQAAVCDPAVNRWPMLTRLSEKAAYFSLDTYFRQTLADLQAAWGEELAGQIRPLASILFRPDAVVGRRIPACLAFLVGHGFAPIAATWRQLAPLIGERIQVDEPGGRVDGTVLDLDDDGALRLRLTGGGEYRVIAGDVTVIRGYDGIGT